MYLTEIICAIAVVVFSFVGGGKSSDDCEHVLFYLYTKSTVDTPQQLLIDDSSSLNASNFDPARKTLIVIHGFQNNVQSPMFQVINNASLKFLHVNVIGVDWGYYAMSLNYAGAVAKARPVGNCISKLTDIMRANGQSESDFLLIGHSLGAHVAGFAGKQCRANGYRVGRISGLDPAFPLYYNMNDPTARLDASDADYVDCFHTNGGMLGSPFFVCVADVSLNGGQHQTGCGYLDGGVCSHARAYHYYAESIIPTHLFIAQTCTEISSLWVPYNCHDEGALMGYPAGDLRPRGVFSLTTNNRYPYAKNITATETGEP